jgi:hypothetical protein
MSMLPKRSQAICFMFCRDVVTHKNPRRHLKRTHRNASKMNVKKSKSVPARLSDLRRRSKCSACEDKDTSYAGDTDRPDVCANCGIQTHHLKLWGRMSITNDRVLQGTCIRCNPRSVPCKVVDEWKERHSPTTAAPMKPGGRDMIEPPPCGNGSMFSTKKRKELTRAAPRGGPSLQCVANFRNALQRQANSPRSTSSCPSTTTTTSRESEHHLGTKRVVCVCEKCGINTHTVGMLRRTSITNEAVYRGKCIQCNPAFVPSKIVEDWRAKRVAIVPSARMSIASLKESFHASIPSQPAAKTARVVAKSA